MSMGNRHWEEQECNLLEQLSENKKGEPLVWEAISKQINEVFNNDRTSDACKMKHSRILQERRQQDLKNSPYIEIKKVVIEKQYNPEYGDDRICKCGHTYHRHFDSYENMHPCGCKYCECYTFVEEIKKNKDELVTVLDTFLDIQGFWNAEFPDGADIWEITILTDLLAKIQSSNKDSDGSWYWRYRIKIEELSKKYVLISDYHDKGTSKRILTFGK